MMEVPLEPDVKNIEADVLEPTYKGLLNMLFVPVNWFVAFV